jgi:hypothetical protein
MRNIESLHISSVVPAKGSPNVISPFDPYTMQGVADEYVRKVRALHDQIKAQYSPGASDGGGQSVLDSQEGQGANISSLGLFGGGGQLIHDSQGGQGVKHKGHRNSLGKQLTLEEAEAMLHQLEKETEQEPAVSAIRHMIAHGIHLVSISASGNCNLHLDEPEIDFEGEKKAPGNWNLLPEKVEVGFEGNNKQEIKVLSCHAKLVHELVEPQEAVHAALVLPFRTE